jgi:plastocyanin
VGALLAFVAACGDDAAGKDDAQVAAERVAAETPLFRGDEAEVVAIDNEFDPKVLKVRSGTEVTFTNEGRQQHDVVPVDGGDFDIPLDEFQPGGTRAFTLTEAGTFRYYCTIHGTETSGMIGTLAVVD